MKINFKQNTPKLCVLQLDAVFSAAIWYTMGCSRFSCSSMLFHLSFRCFSVYLHSCMRYYVRFRRWLSTVQGHLNCSQSLNKTIYCVKSSSSKQNSSSTINRHRRHRNGIQMKSTCNHNTTISVNSSCRFWDA